MEQGQENTQEQLKVDEVFNPTPDLPIDFWTDNQTSVAPEVQSAPVVEPVVETAPVEEAKTEVEPVIQVQEKIVEVEKIVEKELEFKDEYSKSLYEAIAEGKEDEVYNYFKEKYKDYNSMSELDVVRERITKENPTWNQKEIEAEIKFKYGKNLEYKDLDAIDADIEPERYREAVRFNEEVERNLLILERDARDSRIWLNEQKKNIELPKISKEQPVQEQPQFTPEQIEAMTKAWEAEVEKVVPTISDLTWKVGDEEVSYVASNEEKAELTNIMKGFNDVAYLTKRGWYDEKGNFNILKIAEDVRKLENFDKILSSTATQIKTSAVKDTVAEIKNIDYKPNAGGMDYAQQKLGDVLWG